MVSRQMEYGIWLNLCNYSRNRLENQHIFDMYGWAGLRGRPMVLTETQIVHYMHFVVI